MTSKEYTLGDRHGATHVVGKEKAYRAAAASWFFRLGAPGSVDRALAASSSLLDDMEMVFRLDTT